MPTPGRQKRAGIVPYDPRLNPIAPPSVGIFDEPTRPVCINVRWIGHVDGMLERLVWEDAWEGDEATVQFAIGEIRKLMKALALGGDCVALGNFRLQQNPENPCQLLQSFDGGNTYELAFDYGLCANNNGVTSEDLASLKEAIDTLNSQYDGNVNSIAPNMVYDMTDTDDIRDIALCHAINEMVVIMCEMEIEYRRQVSLASTITSVILGLVGVVVTIISGATATPFYMAVAGAIAGGFGAIFSGLSDAILNDKQAREDVACCMYDALKGVTITQTAFENSLDGCGFIGTENNAQLAGAIDQLLTADDVYVTFLDQIEKAYRLADLELVECPCEDGTWTYVSDFATSPNGWQPEVINGATTAQYTTGVNWESVQIQDSGNVYRTWLVMIVQFATPVTVNSFAINYNYQNNTQGSTPRAFITASYLGNEVARDQQDAQNGNNLAMIVTPNTLVDQLYLFFRPSSSQTQSIGWSGSVSINSITASGTGTIPPELT